MLIKHSVLMGPLSLTKSPSQKSVNNLKAYFSSVPVQLVNEVCEVPADPGISNRHPFSIACALL